MVVVMLGWAVREVGLGPRLRRAEASPGKVQTRLSREPPPGSGERNTARASPRAADPAALWTEARWGTRLDVRSRNDDLHVVGKSLEDYEDVVWSSTLEDLRALVPQPPKKAPSASELFVFFYDAMHGGIGSSDAFAVLMVGTELSTTGYRAKADVDDIGEDFNRWAKARRRGKGTFKPFDVQVCDNVEGEHGNLGFVGQTVFTLNDEDAPKHVTLQELEAAYRTVRSRFEAAGIREEPGIFVVTPE